MTKFAARTFSYAFLLTLLAAPAGTAFAQTTKTPPAPTPTAVTGTDPVPQPWAVTGTDPVPDPWIVGSMFQQ